jgi:hypothetical protein
VNSKTIAFAAAAVAALGLAGCSSDSATDSADASSSTAATPADSSPASAPPLSTAPPTPAPAGSLTLSDYLKSAGITETPARPGEAGAPRIELPIPARWETAIDVPGDSFWAIMSTEAGNPSDPPLIQATLTQLSGDVPIQAVFDHAAGELENLPGYQAMGQGGRGSLGGYEAFQIGGMYDNKGTQSLIAQKTLLIASPTGPYLLEVRASGPEADAPVLVAATAQIDDNTVITP